MEQLIKGKDNNIVKLVKSLHMKKYRDLEGKFFAEGIKSISEAVKEGYKIERLICEEGYNCEIGELKDITVKKDFVSSSTFSYISDTRTPQGVLAVFEKKKCTLDELIEKNRLIMILDGVQDPGNVGTIIRTADAVGGVGIDLYLPKTIRATMGSVFRVDVVPDASLGESFSKLKQNDIPIYVTSMNGDKKYVDCEWDKKIAIVMGNEGNGVSSYSISNARDMVVIPMNGKAESLNVAVATSILMYEVIRQKL